MAQSHRDSADRPLGDAAAGTDAKSRQFLRLLLQNERRLYAYILTLLANRADADDVLQEATLVMWDKFEPEQPPTDFAAWGCRIAYFKVLDFFKKAKRSRVCFSQTMLERVSRQQAWLVYGDKLRKDPSVLVYYTFQTNDRWSRTLLDHALERKQPRDGAIVGCSWGQGRWPDTKALDFKRVSDRVRVNVPREYDSLTLAAWVRIDGLPNRNNSLFMSDGWEPGELHWQIGDDGKLILGVQTNPKKGAHYHALGAITPDHLQRWLHLAVVYDRENGVTHYIDGEAASHVPIQVDVPLKIGEAELGNWNVATHQNNTPVRFLSGAMDEFLLVGQAWSAERIAELYKVGRPAP